MKQGDELAPAAVHVAEVIRIAKQADVPVPHDVEQLLECALPSLDPVSKALAESSLQVGDAPIRLDLACRAQLTPEDAMSARAFFRGPGLAAVLADLLHERAPSGHERSSGGTSDGSLARKVDALRYHHSQMSHMFGDDLRPSHRIRAFAAGPPRRHRRCVERVWWPA